MRPSVAHIPSDRVYGYRLDELPLPRCCTSRGIARPCSPQPTSLQDGEARLNHHQHQKQQQQQQEQYRAKGPATWGAPGFRMAVGPVDPRAVAGAGGPGNLYGHALGEGRPAAAERPHRSDLDQVGVCGEPGDAG